MNYEQFSQMMAAEPNAVHLTLRWLADYAEGKETTLSKLITPAVNREAFKEHKKRAMLRVLNRQDPPKVLWNEESEFNRYMNLRDRDTTALEHAVGIRVYELIADEPSRVLTHWTDVILARNPQVAIFEDANCKIQLSIADCATTVVLTCGCSRNRWDACVQVHQNTRTTMEISLGVLRDRGFKIVLELNESDTPPPAKEDVEALKISQWVHKLAHWKIGVFHKETRKVCVQSSRNEDWECFGSGIDLSGSLVFILELLAKDGYEMDPLLECDWPYCTLCRFLDH